MARSCIICMNCDNAAQSLSSCLKECGNQQHASGGGSAHIDASLVHQADFLLHLSSTPRVLLRGLYMFGAERVTLGIRYYLKGPMILIAVYTNLVILEIFVTEFFNLIPDRLTAANSWISIVHHILRRLCTCCQESCISWVWKKDSRKSPQIITDPTFAQPQKLPNPVTSS